MSILASFVYYKPQWIVAKSGSIVQWSIFGVEWCNGNASASQARGPRLETRWEHSSFSLKSPDFVPVAPQVAFSGMRQARIENNLFIYHCAKNLHAVIEQPIDLRRDIQHTVWYGSTDLRLFVDLFERWFTRSHASSQWYRIAYVSYASKNGHTTYRQWWKFQWITEVLSTWWHVQQICPSSVFCEGRRWIKSGSYCEASKLGYILY